MTTIAELKALQAQVHPHFLFNALNTIASFCRTNPLKARELILNLSKFFRNTLDRNIDFTSLGEELDLVNSYLSIEKARFGERLDIIFNIPQNLLEYKIPAFTIQPIVENSVKHGISSIPVGGQVKIDISKVHNFLSVRIIDTGSGMSCEKLSGILQSWPGIGLRSVNERLINYYGPDFGLKIESIEGKGTCVYFRIPEWRDIYEQ
jgi:two-component system LytT family sensor kinase